MIGDAHNPYRYWKTLKCDTEVSCLKFNDDGQLLAVGDNDGNLSLWDVATGRKIHSDQPNDPLPIYDIAWSTDDNLILFGQYPGRYTVWDVPRGRKIKSASIGDDFLTSVDMDRRGSIGLFGGETNLALFDIRTLSIISTTYAHQCNDGFLTSSQFSPDETVILSSGLNDKVKTWEKGSFRQMNVTHFSSPVLRSIYFPRGNEILATCNDQSFRVLESRNLSVLGVGTGISVQSYSNFAVDAGACLLMAAEDRCVHVVDQFGTYQKLQHDDIVEIVECSHKTPVAACVNADDDRVIVWKYPTSR